MVYTVDLGRSGEKGEEYCGDGRKNSYYVLGVFIIDERNETFVERTEQ
jgi:hypothetical protein